MLPGKVLTDKSLKKTQCDSNNIIREGINDGYVIPVRLSKQVQVFPVSYIVSCGSDVHMTPAISCTSLTSASCTTISLLK